jgi:hypothetical protein
MSEPTTLDSPFSIEPEQNDFLGFVVEHFNPTYYLSAFADVAESPLDPLQHWLTFGFAEQRQISRSVVLRQGEVARRSSSRIWRHYRWRGEDVAARLINPLSPEVMGQIVNQARHDPAVFAAGSLEQLSQQDRENGHLDVAGLWRALARRPEFLLAVPDLGTGAAGRFTVDLALALTSMGSIHAIVVDQDSERRCDPSAVPEPWRSIDVLFWRDFWIHGPESVNSAQLAQLISVVHPRVTIVADSRRAFEMVARYGRALSQRTKLYCLCTAEALGNDDNSLLVLQTLPFATALTDDVAFAERLRRHGDQPDHGVVALPSHCAPDFRDAVAAAFRRP